MTTKDDQNRWSSRLAFILAAVGSAVGLANLWRFPYSVGVGGGSAFVFVYLAAVLVLSMPVLIAELLVGRRGRHSPPFAISNVANEAGISTRWKYMGIVGALTAIAILAFYSVVGGWTLAYAVQAITGHSPASADAAANIFNHLNSSAPNLFLWFFIFIGSTILVSALGIHRGIENVVKIMMPALFLILLGLAVYALVTGDAARAFAFLFKPDFSKLTSDVVLDAFGQAFFSLGVGLTNLMAYGAYVERNVSIPRASFVIATADTGIALLAGVAIFPIVFAVGLAPDSGPGLVFQTLPIAFSQMPGGSLVAPAFFLLLFSAALTSSISMMEAPVSWLGDNLGISRWKAAILSGMASFCLGLLCVFSFNVLKDVHPFGNSGILANRDIFGLFDFITTTVVMPASAIMLSVFVGWRLPRALTLDEFRTAGSIAGYSLWRFCLRFVAPIALSVILLSGILR